MSKKDNKRAADIKSRLLNEESPFAKVQLKEKAEVQKKPQQKPKAEIAKKKPGEIVKGYDPSRSFKDILAQFERTGDPYAMPTKAKQRQIESTKTSFGDILDQFENRSNPKAKPQKKEIKKSSYKATQDFASILDKYEGKQSEKAPLQAKNEPSKKDAKKEVKKPAEFKKSSYKPNSDFASILDQYEGKTEPKKVIKEEIKDKKVVILEDAKPISDDPFIKEREDEERSKDAAWSILGGNDNIVRKEVKKEKPKEEKKAPVKKTNYKPTKDFSEILTTYEKKAKPKVEKPIKQKIEETIIVEEPNFFKDSSERSKVAAWSIHGGGAEREKIEKVELPKVEVKTINKSKSKVVNVNFDKVHEIAKKEVEKTFDEIMKEKGDEKETIAEKTINELRRSMPESTLDLHGLTSSEAIAAIEKFLADAKENKLRKIAIIHGKGIHAEGGLGVLKDVAMEELNKSGVVREMNSPPARFGGSGVLWIILKA